MELQAWSILERLEVNMEDLIDQMEDTLESSSISMPALRKQIKSLEEAWIEYEAQYDQVLPGKDGSYASLQHHYYKVLVRADTALEKGEKKEAIQKAKAVAEKATLIEEPSTEKKVVKEASTKGHEKEVKRVAKRAMVW